MDDETVAYEYSLTEVGMPEEWKQGVIAHLMENPALKGNMEGALNMIGAKYEPATQPGGTELTFTPQSHQHASDLEDHQRKIWRSRKLSNTGLWTYQGGSWGYSFQFNS